jgi:hypothetical protein
MVKYIFVPLWFKDFIFCSYASFHITNDTSFIAKNGDDTSVHKLTEVHISTLKKLSH